MTTAWRRGFIVMPKGKMTLEKLATMVQQGFLSMEYKMDSRIDGFAKQLHTRIDQLEARLDKRMDMLEAEIAGIRHQVDQAIYKHEFDALERRVSVLERKTGLRKN